MDDDVTQVKIQYPVFFIGAPEDESVAMAVVVNGEKRLLLYATSELAELYIEQAGDGIVVRSAPDVTLLRRLLNADRTIAGFIWNPTVRPQFFQLFDRAGFFN